VIKQLFKPDSLTLFLVLAIALLFQIFGSSLVFYSANNSLVKYVEAADVISAPVQGFNDDLKTLSAYSSSYEIWYSADGGEHFQNGGSEIDLENLKNPDLKNIESSFHQKPAYGNFPTCFSIVYKVKHKSENITSENNYLTVLNQNSGLPVVNLITPQSNIDGFESGIMTFGEESTNDFGFYKNWWNRNANFQNRGIDSEKEVHFQYFESGKLLFEQDLGMRISGNATRGFPQKSIRLNAGQLYGNDKIEFKFFKEGLKKYTSLVLRNSGNDNTKTMFADLLMQSLARSENLLTQKGKAVCVFLNGNYWGVYNLRERIDLYFIAKNEDVKEDEITLLEGNGSLKEGSEEEQLKFLNFLSEIQNDDLTSSEKYNLADNHLDLISLIDYIFYETFFANQDWPSNNCQYYKAGDKKWKWILQDLDCGLAYKGIQNTEANIFDKLKVSGGAVPDLFNSLIEIEKFKEEFIDRSKYLIQNDLTDERIKSLYAELKSNYQADMDFQIRRWRMIDSLAEWEKNCEDNLHFLLNRKAIYLTQLETL
jgi:hypothetical protein